MRYSGMKKMGHFNLQSTYILHDHSARPPKLWSTQIFTHRFTGRPTFHNPSASAANTALFRALDLV